MLVEGSDMRVEGSEKDLILSLSPPRLNKEAKLKQCIQITNLDAQNSGYACFLGTFVSSHSWNLLPIHWCVIYKMIQSMEVVGAPGVEASLCHLPVS